MSEQPAPTLHEQIRRIVLQLFPWTAFIFEANDDLTIRSASTKIHLAGDAKDPPVARKGDAASMLAFYPGTPAPSYTPPSLWKSDDGGATWAVVATTVIAGPSPNTPGTPMAITAGSARVTCR